jgi:hypothetical protein
MIAPELRDRLPLAPRRAAAPHDSLEVDGPGVLPPAADIFLVYERLADAEAAREGGWRDCH